MNKVISYKTKFIGGQKYHSFLLKNSEGVCVPYLVHDLGHQNYFRVEVLGEKIKVFIKKEVVERIYADQKKASTPPPKKNPYAQSVCNCNKCESIPF